MKNINFDRIIVSSDDNPKFLNFFPIVSCAWNKFYGLSPTLALVTNLDSNDSVIRKLSKFGDIHCFPKIKGIPNANNAKLARFFLASKFPEDIITIEDIDTIPLNSIYVTSKISLRKPNKLLAVGVEVYNGTENEGKFPISTITGEGYLFTKLFNPNNLNYTEAVLSFKGYNFFDKKEDPTNNKNNFSDESLIRALIYKRNFSFFIDKVLRNTNVNRRWIDRSWWDVNAEKLKKEEYDFCNFKRPYTINIKQSKEIFSYLGDNKFNYNYEEVLISKVEFWLKKIGL